MTGLKTVMSDVGEVAAGKGIAGAEAHSSELILSVTLWTDLISKKDTEIVGKFASVEILIPVISSTWME